MKITSFNPLIVTKDAESVIRLFEEMGFEKCHNLQANTGAIDFNSVRMRDAGGFHVDIANIPTMERDMTLIRMNVDDFDEARAFLTEKGFVNPRGDHTVDTKSNKSCMMISPSGFAFDLCQHIREHD